MTNYAKLEFKDIDQMRSFFASQHDLVKKLARQKRGLNGLSPSDERELIYAVRALYLAIIQQGIAWDVVRRYIIREVTKETGLPYNEVSVLVSKAINQPQSDEGGMNGRGVGYYSVAEIVQDYAKRSGGKFIDKPDEFIIKYSRRPAGADISEISRALEYYFNNISIDYEGYGKITIFKSKRNGESLSGLASISLYTAGTNVNIRSGAGTNYSVVRRVPEPNTALTFLSHTAKDNQGYTWLQVEEGWVRQDLVSTRQQSDKDIRFQRMLRDDQTIYLNLVKMSAHYARIHDIANQRWPLPAVGTPGRDAIVKARTDYFTKTGFFKFKEWYNRYQVRQADYRTNKSYSIGNQLTEWGDTIVNYSNQFWLAQKVGEWWNQLFGLGEAPALLIPVLLILGATLTAVAVAYFLTKHEKAVQVDLAETADNLMKLQNADPDTMKAYVEITKAQIDANKEVAEDQNHNFMDSLGEGVKYTLIAGGSVAGLYGLYKLVEHIRRDMKASNLKRKRRKNSN